MKLIVATTALAAVLAAPAIAADTDTSASGLRSAHAAELAYAYDVRQAQRLLVSQGYTGVSDLERVSVGRFVGTAVKDGKTLIVGVNLPKPVTAGAAN